MNRLVGVGKRALIFRILNVSHCCINYCISLPAVVALIGKCSSIVGTDAFLLGRSVPHTCTASHSHPTPAPLSPVGWSVISACELWTSRQLWTPFSSHPRQCNEIAAQRGLVPKLLAAAAWFWLYTHTHTHTVALRALCLEEKMWQIWRHLNFSKHSCNCTYQCFKIE